VVEQCARVIGLLSRVRLDAVVARFLRELTEAPEPGAPPRLRSDSHVARQELFQLCDGMKHVELAADHSRQVRSEGTGQSRVCAMVPVSLQLTVSGRAMGYRSMVLHDPRMHGACPCSQILRSVPCLR